MRTLIKWRFRLSLCPSWKGLSCVRVEDPKFYFFFLSFFLLSWENQSHVVLKTHRLSFILYEKSLKKKTKLKRRHNEGR